MPLPTDEKLLALSENILKQFDTIFGLHPGFRPAHAKGILLGGTFTPAASAANLTRAQHITRPSTPVVARFSDTSGIPLIPDTDPNASPRGLAIRFQLAEHVHTDIVSHSTDGFPTHTGDEFLEFLRAPRGQRPGQPQRLAARSLPRFAPCCACLRADTQAGALQLRPRKLLRRHRHALHQPAGNKSLRSLHNSA